VIDREKPKVTEKLRDDRKGNDREAVGVGRGECETVSVGKSVSVRGGVQAGQCTVGVK
jgi:hypothetical protein